MKPSSRFWISAGATVLWMVMMANLIRPLNSRMIVAFEFAGSVEKATAIVQEWSTSGIVSNAYLSIYLDFVFLVLYSLTIYLALRWALEFSSSRVKTITNFLLIVLWVAPAMDCIENFALLSVLSTPTPTAIKLAFAAATLKFIIVGLSLLYLLAFLIFIGLRKLGF